MEKTTHTITTHRFISTGDKGQAGLVLVEERDGLVQVSDEVLRKLMVQTNIRNLPAGRSPDHPGVNFLRYPDMARLLTAAGMLEEA